MSTFREFEAMLRSHVVYGWKMLFGPAVSPQPREVADRKRYRYQFAMMGATYVLLASVLVHLILNWILPVYVSSIFVLMILALRALLYRWLPGVVATRPIRQVVHGGLPTFGYTLYRIRPLKLVTGQFSFITLGVMFSLTVRIMFSDYRPRAGQAWQVIFADQLLYVSQVGWSMLAMLAVVRLLGFLRQEMRGERNYRVSSNAA